MVAGIIGLSAWGAVSNAHVHSGIVPSLHAAQNGGCSVATLSGDYLLVGEAAPTLDRRDDPSFPRRFAGIHTFDGQGHLSGFVTSNQGGTIQRFTNEGTHTLESNCTGTRNHTLPRRRPLGSVHRQRWERGPLRPHGRGIHCDSFHQKAVARGASLGTRRILLFALVGFTFVPAARAQVCVPPPPGMVSWWPGDGNANDIQDGNHGTLRNGATFAPGKVGQAFSLDGVAASVDVPASPNPNITSSFTLDDDGTIHGYLLSGDAVTSIDVPDAVYTIARGVNSRLDTLRGVQRPRRDDPWLPVECEHLHAD